MRIPRVLLVAALALVPAAATAQISDIVGTGGRVEFGVRATDLSGDPARYERYRDLGDGLFMDTLRLHNNSERWWVSFSGDHVGRRDMRYRLDAIQHGRFKFWGVYDQIPMLMSRTTQTLFSEPQFAAGISIPSDVRAAFAASPELRPAILSANGRVFDTRTTRYIAEAGMEYIATPAWTLSALFRFTNRKGSIPFGVV